MKTIEQLLRLKLNPYYKFTPEESTRLTAFLSQSKQKTEAEKKSSDLSENTHATVINRNIVRKHDTVVPAEDRSEQS